MNLEGKRPVGITLLSFVFLWIGSIGTLAFLLIALSGGMTKLLVSLVSGWFASELLTHIVSWFLAFVWFSLYVIFAITGFGLWRLKNWGRKSAFVINATGAGVSVIALPIFVRPPVLILPMIIGTVIPFALIAWYLRRPAVRRAFGGEVIAEDLRTHVNPSRPNLRKVWIALAGFAAILLFVGSLGYAVTNMIRASDPYKMAIRQAEGSTCVHALIGTPLKEGWLTTGRIEESSDRGSANLSIPVRGTVGKGRLLVTAEKRQGSWTISTLSLARDRGEIQLAPTEEPCR